MTDVFMSYASEDKERVALLVKVLESNGLSVWWDRNIQPGRSFSDVIEEALDKCRCVIVAWTPNAVRSRWVNAEAAEGARQEKLIPILLEETKIPLEFRRIHTAQLTSWKGDSNNEEIFRIIAAIRDVIGVQDTGTTSISTSNKEKEENQSVTTPEIVYGKSYSIFPYKFLHIFYKSVPYVVGFLSLAFIIWIYGPLLSIGNIQPLSGVMSRFITIVFLCIICSIILYFYYPARRIFSNTTSFYFLWYVLFSFIVVHLLVNFVKYNATAPLEEKIRILERKID